jgi:hypothetical protein
LAHSHQTFLLLPGRTLSGVSGEFLVGCHWAANSGYRVLSDVGEIAVLDNFENLDT